VEQLVQQFSKWPVETYDKTLLCINFMEMPWVKEDVVKFAVQLNVQIKNYAEQLDDPKRKEAVSSLSFTLSGWEKEENFGDSQDFCIERKNGQLMMTETPYYKVEYEKSEFSNYEEFCEEVEGFCEDVRDCISEEEFNNARYSFYVSEDAVYVDDLPEYGCSINDRIDEENEEDIE
jgi:hypothetical protein